MKGAVDQQYSGGSKPSQLLWVEVVNKAIVMVPFSGGCRPHHGHMHKDTGLEEQNRYV